MLARAIRTTLDRFLPEDAENDCLRWISCKLRRIRTLCSSNTGSRFKRNFIKVAKANIVARALPILIAPLLTRLFTPADFGALALFTSALGLLVSFSGWRFDWSIPNAESDLQATALVTIGFSVLCAFGISIFLALWMFGADLSFWKGFDVLGWLIFLLPVSVVGAGLYQLMSAWFIRQTDLTAVGKTKIVQSVAGSSVKIASGVAGFGAIGLIAGTIVNECLGIVTLFKQAHGMRENIPRLSFKVIKDTWKKFWGESTASTMAAVINKASLTVTPLLLAQYYSATEVGWYALMYQIGVLPVSLFSAGLAQSFWAEAADLIKTDRATLRRLYIKTTKRLLLATIPIILICLAGPLYVGTLFGKAEWGGAGWILGALTPMLVGGIVVSTTDFNLVVHRKQSWLFIWDSGRVILLITTITVCARLHLGIAYTVLLVSLNMLVMYAVSLKLNLMLLKERRLDQRM